MDYKKILEGVVDIINTTEKSDIGFANICAYIGENFPELEESEDERIRKWLIALIKSNEYGSISNVGEMPCPKLNVLAWLEKQGSVHLAWSEEDNNMLKWVIEYLKNRMLNAPISEERTACKNAIAWLEKLKDEKKPADEIEQKFKVGDWIVGANSVLKIISLNDELNCYIAVTPNNEEVKIPYYFDDGKGHMCSYHLWTIQDANDGDALSDGTTIFIFKDLLSDGSVMSYCDYDTDSGESDAFCPLSMNLMCSKITPATKEQRDLLFPKMKEAGYEWDAEKKELKKIEQKPVKVPKFKVGDFIQFNGMGHTRYTIKEVCGLSHYINTCNKRMDMSYTDANFELVEHKSAKWSEEDGKILNSLISSLARIGASTRTDSTSINYTFSKEIDWLKSLKPQNKWKPNDEQMLAINTAINVLGKGTLNGKQLIELREELQKLREE